MYLAPIEIFLAPDSPYKGIEPTQMAALTAAFADILRDEVLKNANVVDTPQPDSMVVQIALTDVRLDEALVSSARHHAGRHRDQRGEARRGHQQGLASRR